MPSDDILLTVENAAAKSRAWLTAELACNPYPAARFAGRGIVIAAGGLKYGTCAYVAVRALRHVGCTLPIEIWYRGLNEYLPAVEDLMCPLDVRWVDAYEVRRTYPHLRLNGYELKPYAIQHSRFREVIFVDADNVAVRDPAELFDSDEYRSAGTLLWPDYSRLGRDRLAWRLFGAEYRDEWEVESGQIVIDKARAWPALLLADWYAQRSELTFRHVLGDKELFHLCWRALGQPYAMPEAHIHTLHAPGGRHSTMCQHDFRGRRMFEHRNGTKWDYVPHLNPRVPGFQLEVECLEWLADLRRFWHPAAKTLASDEDITAIAALEGRAYTYERTGGGARPLQLGCQGTFQRGAARCERWWTIRDGRLLIAAEDGELTMDLTPTADGGWDGRWLVYERMPVRIRPPINALPPTGQVNR